MKNNSNNDLKCSICNCKEKDTPKFYRYTIFGENLCNKHYLQLYRHGEITDDKPSYKLEYECYICHDTEGEFRICYEEGELLGKSLCTKHHSQMRTKGLITDPNINQKKVPRICSVCNDIKNVIYNPNDGEMYCRRHYDQLKIYGMILNETIFDRNKYEVKSTYAEIILKNRNFQEVGRAFIDIEDLERVILHKWSLNSWGYACCGRCNEESSSKYYMLQNYILQQDGLIDHINRNPLDNRKINLCKSNKSLNALNCNIRITNKSGCTGVALCNRTKKWRAYINWNGKRIELGIYADKDKAIKARLEKENGLLGNLAPQKDLFKQYSIEIK